MKRVTLYVSIAAAAVLFGASVLSDDREGVLDMACSVYDTALMEHAISQTLGLGEAAVIVDPRCMSGADGYRAFRIKENVTLEGLSFSDATAPDEAPLSMLSTLMPEAFPGLPSFEGYELASRYDQESNIGVHVLRRKDEAGCYVVLVADLL